MISPTRGSGLDDRSPSSSSSSRYAAAHYVKSSLDAEGTLDIPFADIDVRKKRINGRKGKFVELTCADNDDGSVVDGGTGGSAGKDGAHAVRKSEAETGNNLDVNDANALVLNDDPLLPLECILREAAFGISDAFQLEPGDDDLNVDIVKANSNLHKRPSSNLRVLFQLLAFNVVLCVVQMVCGAIANSLALLGDGMLMGVDVITYIVNIYVERKKKISSQHRAKVDQWGAILSLVLLSFTTVWIFVDSIDRLLYPEDVIVDGRIMFIFTLFNLLVDALLVRNFLKSGADSSSMNMKSALLHLGADIVRGFGVLVSSCWIWTHPGDGMVADAVCSLFVSVFILFSTMKIGGSLFYQICFDPTELVDEGTLKEVIGVYDAPPMPQGV